MTSIAALLQAPASERLVALGAVDVAIIALYFAVVLGIGPSGAGTPRWWKSDGPLLPLRFSPRLDQLCAGVATDQPYLQAAPHRGR